MKKYMSIVAAAFLLASCEKTISVKTPPHTSALVINSNTMTDDTIRVSIGKSMGVTAYKTKSDLNVSNATVVLTEDGTPVQSLKYDPQTQTYNSTLIAKAGKTYAIKASATGFTDAEATTIAPSFVTIESIKVTPNARTTNNEQQDELLVTFTDPPAAGDYYMIRINPLPPQGIPDSVRMNYQYYYSECVFTPDPSVESVSNDEIDQNTCHSSNGVFFRDALFNGTRKELKLYVRSGLAQMFIVDGTDTLRPELELYHMTEAYFRYMKTTQFVAENEGNPFAEPTTIYSNIKNGYGIFSVVSADAKEIK